MNCLAGALGRYISARAAHARRGIRRSGKILITSKPELFRIWEEKIVGKHKHFSFHLYTNNGFRNDKSGSV